MIFFKYPFCPFISPFRLFTCPHCITPSKKGRNYEEKEENRIKDKKEGLPNILFFVMEKLFFLLTEIVNRRRRKSEPFSPFASSFILMSFSLSATSQMEKNSILRQQGEKYYIKMPHSCSPSSSSGIRGTRKMSSF